MWICFLKDSDFTESAGCSHICHSNRRGHQFKCGVDRDWRDEREGGNNII